MEQGKIQARISIASGWMMCWLVLVQACVSYDNNWNSDVSDFTPVDVSDCAPVEVVKLNCSGGLDADYPFIDQDPILSSEECKGSWLDSPVCFQAYANYVCPGDPTIADGIDFESRMIVKLWNGVCGCDVGLEPVRAEICDDSLKVYYVAYGDFICDVCLEMFQLVSLPRTDLPVNRIFQGWVTQ